MPNNPLETPCRIDAVSSAAYQFLKAVELRFRTKPERLGPPRRKIKISDVSPLALPRELPMPDAAVSIREASHPLDKGRQAADWPSGEVFTRLVDKGVECLLHRPVSPRVWSSGQVDVPDWIDLHPACNHL